MKYSIIVPVYNCQDYLGECLSSIVSQNQSEWECILVDDGSTDRSANICDEIAAIDSRFKVIHTSNKGVSEARNLGINEASGDYLFFIDSDDWIDNNILKEYGNFDVIIGEYTMVFGTNTSRVRHKVKSSDDYALSFLHEEIRACVGSFIVKRKLVIDKGVFFETGCRYGEDMSFILRVLLLTKCVSVLPNIFCYYRQNDKSAMKKITLNRFDVFYSRLSLASYSEGVGNRSVADFLLSHSCIEAIVEVSMALLRDGMNVKEISSYISKKPEVLGVLESTINNTSEYRTNALLLLRYPRLLQAKVGLLRFYYYCRQRLGRIRLFLQRK